MLICKAAVYVRVCVHKELTYSAESAGRMDIGETWELQSQRGEKDNLVRTLRIPGPPSKMTVPQI